MVDVARGGPAPETAGRFDPLEAMVGVLTRPGETMRRIAAVRPWPAALVVSSAILLLEGIAGLTAPAADPAAAAGARGQPAMIEALLGVAQDPPLIALNALVFGPLLLAATTGLIYLAGGLLGGRGTFAGLLATQGFATTPGLVLAPLTALVNVGATAPAAAFAGVLLALGFAIWGVVLQVIGVRESLGLSTGRAALALLLPIAALVALAALAALLVVALALVAGAR
jgi:hypothetical protein